MTSQWKKHGAASPALLLKVHLGVAYLTGVISPTETITTGVPETLIATLPKNVRPKYRVWNLAPVFQYSHAVVIVNTDGTITMSRKSEAGKLSDMEPLHYLAMDMSFPVD